LYRLNVLPLTLLPLRERREDVLPLAEHYLRFFEGRQGRHRLAFSERAKQALLEHRWPGNLRELRNTVERAVILSPTEIIEPEDFGWPSRDGAVEALGGKRDAQNRRRLHTGRTRTGAHRPPVGIGDLRGGNRPQARYRPHDSAAQAEAVRPGVTAKEPMMPKPRTRSLKRQFLFAGGLFVVTTIVCGAWAALMFARMSGVIDETNHQQPQRVRPHGGPGEHPRTGGRRPPPVAHRRRRTGRNSLADQRATFEELYGQLRRQVTDTEQLQRAEAMRERVEDYRSAGDAMVNAPDETARGRHYHQQVNPKLRLAIEECDQIRELTFRSMEQTGLRARDEARRGTLVVVAISLVALVVSTSVAVGLSRVVVNPVRDLMLGVEAVRQGDFDRRVPLASLEELRLLGEGFNRMAETLGEYRASSLGELLQAKSTLESTIASIPSAVIVVDPDGRIESANPPGRKVLDGLNGAATKAISDVDFPAPIRDAVEQTRRGLSVPDLEPTWTRRSRSPSMDNSARCSSRSLRFLSFRTDSPRW
jgi:PAS domain-containing protein